MGTEIHVHKDKWIQRCFYLRIHGYREIPISQDQGLHKKTNPKEPNKTYLKKNTCKWTFLGFNVFYKEFF